MKDKDLFQLSIENEEDLKDFVFTVMNTTEHFSKDNALIKNLIDGGVIKSNDDLIKDIASSSEKILKLILNNPPELRDVAVVSSLVESNICNHYLGETIKKLLKQKTEMEELLVHHGLAVFKEDPAKQDDTVDPIPEKRTLH